MRILHRSFFSIHLIWLTAGLALVACGTKGDKASSSPLEIPKQAFEVPPEVPSVTEPDTGHKPSEGKEQKLLRLEPSGELLAAGVRQSERHRPPKQVLLVTPNTSLRVIVRAIQNSDGLATDSLGVESSTTGKTLPLPPAETDLKSELSGATVQVVKLIWGDTECWAFESPPFPGRLREVQLRPFVKNTPQLIEECKWKVWTGEKGAYHLWFINDGFVSGTFVKDETWPAHPALTKKLNTRGAKSLGTPKRFAVSWFVGDGEEYLEDAPKHDASFVDEVDGVAYIKDQMVCGNDAKAIWALFLDGLRIFEKSDVDSWRCNGPAAANWVDCTMAGSHDIADFHLLFREKNSRSSSTKPKDFTLWSVARTDSDLGDLGREIQIREAVSNATGLEGAQCGKKR